jgi:hypothetical protein
MVAEVVDKVEVVVVVVGLVVEEMEMLVEVQILEEVVEDLEMDQEVHQLEVVEE